MNNHTLLENPTGYLKVATLGHVSQLFNYEKRVVAFVCGTCMHIFFALYTKAVYMNYTHHTQWVECKKKNVLTFATKFALGDSRKKMARRRNIALFCGCSWTAHLLAPAFMNLNRNLPRRLNSFPACHTHPYSCWNYNLYSNKYTKSSVECLLLAVLSLLLFQLLLVLCQRNLLAALSFWFRVPFSNSI